jgi:hypothetical protein
VSVWRRFRGLRPEAQVGVWLAIAAVYTVGLVVLLGGGSGDEASGDPRASWSAREKRIARAIEMPPTKDREIGDVPAFRKPVVDKVDCEDSSCSIVYASGLPGNGRIVEDQQPILARLYADEELDRLTIRVVRATSVGPGTAAKPAEEAPPGIMLLETRCVRSEKAKSLPDEQLDLPPVPAECTSAINNGIGQQQSAASRGESAAPPASSGGGGGGGLVEEQR